MGFNSILSATGRDLIRISEVFKNNSILSPWEEKMVKIDLRKAYFYYVKKWKADYCIIDLIDERYDLLRVRNSYYLLSAQLKKIGNIDRIPGAEIIKQDNLPIRNREQLISEYCQRLCEIYPPHKIILYRSKMVDCYKDGKKIELFPNQEYIYEYNKRVEYYYEMISYYIPQCVVADMPQNTYGDVNHKWGNHPFHYTEEYYRETAGIIDRIIGGL